MSCDKGRLRAVYGKLTAPGGPVADMFPDGVAALETMFDTARAAAPPAPKTAAADAPRAERLRALAEQGRELRVVREAQAVIRRLRDEYGFVPPTHGKTQPDGTVLPSRRDCYGYASLAQMLGHARDEPLSVAARQVLNHQHYTLGLPLTLPARWTRFGDFDGDNTQFSVMGDAPYQAGASDVLIHLSGQEDVLLVALEKALADHNTTATLRCTCGKADCESEARITDGTLTLQKRGVALTQPIDAGLVDELREQISRFQDEQAQMVAPSQTVGVERCVVCGRWQSAEQGHTCAARRIPQTLPEDLRVRLGPAFEAIRAIGGRPLLVGGAVRDLIAGRVPKDADIEVYDLDPNALQTALSRLGTVNAVGKTFGVLKVRTPNGDELDVSIPRRENKSGQGHKGFLVQPDPTMTIAEAAQRRDFTWNAMSYDSETEEIIDPVGGLDDLQAGIIRHTSAAFAEDPLRVLRAVQFAARFGMRLAPETAALCQTLRAEAQTLPQERVWAEWQKLVVKGKQPGLGLAALKDSGWLAEYPQLAALPGVPQDPTHHPEGDVWTHTRHVADAAAVIAARDDLNDHDRTVLLLAAICHDLGKAGTTVTTPDGHITAHGHEEASVPLAEALLHQIGVPGNVIAEVLPLVRLHLRHLPLIQMEQDITNRRARGEDTLALSHNRDRMLRRLAVACAPASLTQLARMIAADLAGRPPLPARDPLTPLLVRAQALGAETGAPARLLMGRDLIAVGLRPSPDFRRILDAAYTAQIEGVFSDVDGARAWLRAQEVKS